MLRFIYLVCFLGQYAIGLHGQQVVEAIPFKATGPCGITQTVTHDNGIFVALEYRGTLEAFGQSFGSGNQNDLILFSLDNSGELLWFLESSSRSDDNSVDLKYDFVTQRLYWAGMFWDELEIGGDEYGITTGSRGIFVSAINAITGEPDWVRILMGDSQKQVSALALDQLGNLFCTGYYKGTLIVNEQISLIAERLTYMFVLQYNQSGQVILHRNFGGDADIRPIDCVSDGLSLYVAGTINGRVNFDRDTITGRLLDTDIFICRVDANGQNPWAKLAGGVYDKNVADLIWSNGKLLMAGYFIGEILFRDGLIIQTNGLNIDGFIAAYDQLGYALDATTIAGPGAIFPSDISKRNGDIVLSGSWVGSIFDDNNELVQAPSGTRQGFVFRLSTELNKLEFTHLTSDGIVSDVQFRKSSAGMEFLSLNFSMDVSLGDREWISQGTFEGLLLKLDVLSDSNTLLIDEIEPVLFPNPVMDRLHCSGCFGLRYTIIDVQGRILSRQVYHQEIDVSRMVSGIYALVVEDGKGGKMTLRFLKQ